MTPTTPMSRVSARCGWQHAAFNLVEVVLAMVIVAIGVLAIVGLIPIGAEANQKAVANHYAADAADQMLSYTAAIVKNNWDATLKSAALLPNESMPDISSTPSEIGSTAAEWRAVASSNFPNLYYWDNASSQRLYRIQQTSSSGILDFDGILRLWKTPTIGWQCTTDPGTGVVTWSAARDTTYSRRAQINLELSWPAALPYKARQKAYYALEVSKLN